MQISKSRRGGVARGDTTRGQSSESHVICAMPAISVAYLWGRGNGDAPVCNNSGDFVNTNLSACYVLVSVQLLHVSRRQKTSKEEQGMKTLVRARKSVCKDKGKLKRRQGMEKETRQQKKKQPPPH